MSTPVRNLLRSTGAASSAEFALVLPLFLILLLGVIDAGRFMYQYNRAEKATQVGTRVAIVTNVLSPGLRDEDYADESVGGTPIGPGNRIPAAALGTIKCDVGGCTCETGPCPSDLGTMDSSTFNDVLVARMKQIDPLIADDNVVVRYSGSGFGFAGSSGGGGGGSGPEQMEISPLVTVTLTGLQFTPITSFLLAQVDMPDLSATLSAEDASGAYSN